MTGVRAVRYFQDRRLNWNTHLAPRSRPRGSICRGGGLIASLDGALLDREEFVLDPRNGAAVRVDFDRLRKNPCRNLFVKGGSPKCGNFQRALEASKLVSHFDPVSNPEAHCFVRWRIIPELEPGKSTKSLILLFKCRQTLSDMLADDV